MNKKAENNKKQFARLRERISNLEKDRRLGTKPPKKQKKRKKRKKEKIMQIPDFKTYQEFMKSGIWKKLRKQTLKRDNNKCVHCGEKAVSVHHKFYVKWGTEKLDYLESVCKNCHQLIHDLENEKKSCK
jgi:5-methylcytosine-specific restriction endonuclease McrA